MQLPSIDVLWENELAGLQCAHLMWRKSAQEVERGCPTLWLACCVRVCVCVCVCVCSHACGANVLACLRKDLFSSFLWWQTPLFFQYVRWKYCSCLPVSFWLTFYLGLWVFFWTIFKKLFSHQWLEVEMEICQKMIYMKRSLLPTSKYMHVNKKLI